MSGYQRNRGRRPRPGAQQNKAGRGWWLYLAIPAVIVVALAVVVPMLRPGGSSSPGLPEGVAFPSYVQAGPFDVKEAYAYAVEHPEVLQYMPCYCGCGQHSGHTGIHDCFVQQGHITGGPVVFDSHGANCQMCVDIARDAKRLVQQGKTLQEARQYVAAQYGGLGPATNTPPIP